MFFIILVRLVLLDLFIFANAIDTSPEGTYCVFRFTQKHYARKLSRSPLVNDTKTLYNIMAGVSFLGRYSCGLFIRAAEASVNRRSGKMCNARKPLKTATTSDGNNNNNNNNHIECASCRNVVLYIIIIMRHDK